MANNNKDTDADAEAIEDAESDDSDEVDEAVIAERTAKYKEALRHLERFREPFTYVPNPGPWIIKAVMRDRRLYPGHEDQIEWAYPTFPGQTLDEYLEAARANPGATDGDKAGEHGHDKAEPGSSMENAGKETTVDTDAKVSTRVSALGPHKLTKQPHSEGQRDAEDIKAQVTCQDSKEAQVKAG